MMILIGILAWFSLSSWAAPLDDILAAKSFQELAKTYSEWEQSPHTPHALSEKFRALSDPGELKQFCETLKKLKVSDLFYAHEFLEQAHGKCFVSQKLRYQKYLKRSSQRLLSKYINYQQWEKTEEIPLDAKESPVVIDGHLEEKTLVLTFDDGPHPVRTQQLLKLLKESSVKAQFFLVGSNTLLYQDAVNETAADGHEIGCHSFTHPDMRKLAYEVAVKEIEDGFAAIRTVLGRPGHFWRYPYGASTAKLQAYLRQTSTTEFYWNIDTLDWKYKDPDFLLDYALKQVDAEGRGVVLFHDIQPQTLAIMPAFLAALKSNGYKLAIFRPTRPRDTPQP